MDFVEAAAGGLTENLRIHGWKISLAKKAHSRKEFRLSPMVARSVGRGALRSGGSRTTGKAEGAWGVL
jgi:hypothetical protein